MIKLYTDSVSYIPSDLLIEHKINVLPLSFTMDGREYAETEISNENFYSTIKKTNVVPKSKPLAIDTLEEAFEKETEQGNSVIAIFLTSKGSETYANAKKAKDKVLQKYPRANITVIDSGSVAMEEGLAVLAAAEVIERGSWLEDIVTAADDCIRHTKFMFVPKTLKYLQISGKLGKAQAMLGNALQITPLLRSKNGTIEVMEKIRLHSKAIDRMLEIYKEDIDKYGVKDVIIHHIDNIEEAMKIAERAEEIAGMEVPVCDIGPVLGANIGPGTVGIVYRTAEQIQ